MWARALFFYDDFFEPDEFIDGSRRLLGDDPQKRAQREDLLKTLRGRETQTARYHISGAFKDDVVLETGPLGQAFDAMRACIGDLVSSFGVDAEDESILQKSASPQDVADWARPIMRRYPSNLLRTGDGGRVVLSVLVEADGRPLRCKVIEPTVDEDYEAQTCRTVMRSAEFAPAISADGIPVRSMDQITIVYRMN